MGPLNCFIIMTNDGPHSVYVDVRDAEGVIKDMPDAIIVEANLVHTGINFRDEEE